MRQYCTFCVLSNLWFDVFFHLALQNEIPLLLLLTNSYNLSVVGIWSWVERWRLALTASLFIVPSTPNVAFPPRDIATIKPLCDFYYHIFQMFFCCSNLSTLFHHTDSQPTKLNFLVIGWQRMTCSVFISVRYCEEKCAALYHYYLGCIPYAGGSNVAWLLLQWLPPITS